MIIPQKLYFGLKIFDKGKPNIKLFQFYNKEKFNNTLPHNFICDCYFPVNFISSNGFLGCFRQCGLEATIIKPVEGQQSRRMFYLKKAEIIKPIANPQGRPKTPQGIMRDMSKHEPKSAERDFGNKRLNMDKPLNALK